MQIGNVIRKYRKEKNMTQEEIAGYLGVTAPAVNKWENGNACPDIALLAPLARLLGISTDTLLSYKEELTRDEIIRIVNETAKCLMKEPYDAVFQRAMEKVREYPNCDFLSFMLAQILDSYFVIGDVDGKEAYKKEIRVLYERALASEDEMTKQGALQALYNECMMNEDYEKAQVYLDQIPDKIIDKKKMQASIYRRSGKKEEAYRLYEGLIYQAYSDLSVCFQGMYSLALEEKENEKAERMVEKQVKLAELLEMSDYMVLYPRLHMVLERKDKEESLNLLEEMIDAVQTISDFTKSDLYSHLEFNKNEKRNDGMVAKMLHRGFETDEQIDFLREEERFQKLMQRLERMESQYKEQE